MARKPRPFVAWDGEALGGEDEELPRYAMLAGSHPYPPAWDPQGLSTVKCLDWLLGYAAAHPGIHIGYGTAYDVNMILGDMDQEELETLYLDGELGWGPYWLEWIPGKIFIIRHENGGYIKTSDTLGFFQCSFITALDRWGLEVPEHLEAMKQARGSFTEQQFGELYAYSRAECELLVELMGLVRESLHSQGLRVANWHGAGAIASAALRKAGTKSYKSPARRPQVEELVLRAYFGGRTELFRQGHCAEAVQYDINSAYAAALQSAPDGRGQWRRARTYEQFAPYAIWRVSWDIDDGEELVAPFPYRTGRSIFYPVRGEGWYHADELRKALQVYPEKIAVHTGYVFEPHSATKPFAFLGDLYQLRQSLRGQPVASALKFGLSSVWGKTAQGTRRDGRVPPYQDFFWSGYATQLVRSWMLGMAAENRERLVQISTDSLLLSGRLAKEPMDKKLGSELGWMKRTDLYSLLVAQPGIIDGWERESGERISSTRGYFRKELDFEQLRQVWEEAGPLGVLQTKGMRFYGLGTCLAMGSLTRWRRWILTTQNLSLYASRKFYEQGDGGRLLRLLPPYEIRKGASQPYEPKRNALETRPDLLDWIQGNEQPMVTF